MKVNHLVKPFCVDEAIKLGPKEIDFSNLYTNKSEHKGEFYNVKYTQASLNEVMYSYYGAKISCDHKTFGGPLPLIREFLTSIIVYTISNLRSGKE